MHSICAWLFDKEGVWQRDVRWNGGTAPMFVRVLQSRSIEIVRSLREVSTNGDRRWTSELYVRRDTQEIYQLSREETVVLYVHADAPHPLPWPPGELLARRAAAALEECWRNASGKEPVNSPAKSEYRIVVEAMMPGDRKVALYNGVELL